MRLRALLTLLIGAVVAGSAVVYIHVFMKSPIAQQPMRDVVVVVDNIPFGDIVKAEMLAVQAWPAHAVPNGTFSSLTQVIGADEKQSRRAKFALAKGDLLLESKISDFGEPVSITQQIDPSMRAVTIHVNDATGVAGLVAPADRIDLTLTRRVDQQLTTATILQDVEVLGIDQSRKGKSDSGQVRTVTVQVDPVDAQKLALAQQAGTLSLSLRHIDAADRPALHSISVDDLAAADKKVEPLVKRPGLPRVVVNRRGERLTVEVPSG